MYKGGERPDQPLEYSVLKADIAEILESVLHIRATNKTDL